MKSHDLRQIKLFNICDNFCRFHDILNKFQLIDRQVFSGKRFVTVIRASEIVT